MYHRPVLLKESIEGLNIRKDGVYVDATFGGGGHSRAILERLENGKLIAFDHDEDAWKNAFEHPCFVLIKQNFSYLKNFVKMLGYTSVDGILADLGVSSHQLDTAKRGFSIRNDAPLDLRMDKRNPLTAADLLKQLDIDELKKILKNYGELENAGRVATAICKYRSQKPVETTFQLREALSAFYHHGNEHKFLAKVFQALRIHLNDELEALKSLLKASSDLLKTGGRLVIISYNSLEDRLVKNFFRSGNFEGTVEKDFYGNPLSPFRLVTRKAIVPDETEIKENNRARSAKLRIAEKK